MFYLNILITALCLFSYAQPELYENTCISVSNQVEFQEMPSRIKKAVKSGASNIIVNISPGRYTYTSNFLNLSEIENLDLSISILGDDVILTPCMDLPHSPEQFEYNRTWLTQGLSYVDPQMKSFVADSMIEVVDKDKRLCRVMSPEMLCYVPGMSIKINEWYKTSCYPVTKIDGNYIYFIANDLMYDKAKKCYNVNYDFVVCDIKPRYSILLPPQSVGNVYQCSNSMFMVLYRDKIKSFSLCGVTFVGSDSNKQIIQIRDVVASDNISIKNCIFRYVHSTILLAQYSENIVFANNNIENCFGRCVWARYTTKNIQIKDNKFTRSVMHVDNVPCISCGCENFYISNNQFVDFGSTAISVGVKYTQGAKYIVSGIVENNLIRYSTPYASYMQRYSTTDGGAIYVSTKNDDTVIRYNFVDNYCGARSKRCLYCDDGAYNVKIYGNIFLQGDDSHSVFSWRCKAAEKMCPLANTGIVFGGNIIKGKYKLEERRGCGCIQKQNVVIIDNREPENVLLNFDVTEEDVFIDDAPVINGKVRMFGANKKIIKSLPTFSGMKRWLE